MKDGILIIDKPQKWTSHDCVAVCRRATGAKKVGHGGTLDPMAEGLLAVFVGKATRIMEYLELDSKKYRCTAKLGLVTDTQDIWGEVQERRSTAGVTAADIERELGKFTGQIEQLPPMYSAVRVKGRRLYEYARDGQDVELRPRKVNVEEIALLDIDMKDMTVTFDIKCSKGTYIRSICRDLGEALGCGGTMSALRRTESGVFTLEEAVSPGEIKGMRRDEIEARLVDTDQPLVNFGKAELAPDRARYFRSGNAIRWKQVKVLERPSMRDGKRRNSRGRAYESLYRVYDAENGAFLGMGYHSEKDDELKADKVFDVI